MREPVHQQVAALYAGVTDPDLWRSALAGISSQLGARGMCVLFGESGAESAVASGVTEEELAGIRNWLAARAAAEGGRPADAADGIACWQVADVASCESSGGRHCLIRLDRDGATVGYAGLYREAGSGAFEPEVVESFLALAQPLAQALALAVRLAQAELSVRRCSQCNDMLPFGCVLLDAGGTVMDMNPAAADMLDAADGLCLAGGRLHAQRDGDEASLDGLLSATLGGAPATGAAFVRLPRPSGRRPYVVFIGRLNVAGSIFAGRIPGARLVIVDSDRASVVPREVMRAVYELTETESHVAWRLANGETPEQAAQHLGIAHNTLRHHLERIFAKTGAHRQTDLVRRVQAPFVSVDGMQ